MPAERDDETPAHAEHEAKLASAYFDALVGMGKTERVAAQLTSAWILGRLRRERDDEGEPWER